jgi:hypothetical protein
MFILDPELLKTMRELPLMALGGAAVIGLCLWITGWWLHRFWITLIATLCGGIIGLMYGPDLGVKQAIVAGVLLALASGCLALSLARVAVFLIYGGVTWYVTMLVTPQWAVPLICVTVGGLLSIWCFRLSMSLLTTSLAAVLLAYSGLLLADLFFDFKAAAYLKAYPWAEFVVLGFVSLLGVGVQFRIQRAQDKAALRKLEQQELRAKMEALQQQAVAEAEQERLQSRRWWQLGRRRAG